MILKQTYINAVKVLQKVIVFLETSDVYYHQSVFWKPSYVFICVDV